MGAIMGKPDDTKLEEVESPGICNERFGDLSEGDVR
jgi:hypothetical protein